MVRAEGRSDALVLAIDVGSTSARAGVFDLSGHMLSAASAPFDTHRPQKDHAEHDSEQIWSAVCAAVREAALACGRPAAAISGIAFDATCSLVMLDAGGAPVTVSTTGEDRWNVVMWADHRATGEALEITATGHRVLDYVGNTMSPEMELPKLLWLKRQLPRSWARYGMAMDLADYLTWRATGSVSASACTVTCKWTYLNHESPGWQNDFLARIGLDGLQRHLRIPAEASQVGSEAGRLSADTARAWGLQPGIAVAVGVIDAHAGAVGVLAATPAADLNNRLALIAGTSNCHMAMSRDARRIPGIWGPYFGAALPGWWLNEGGQSASGASLDHALATHVLGKSLGDDPHGALAEYLMRRRADEGPAYAQDMLVVPDFHGNRSPLARPDVRGVIHGLDLDASLEGLAKFYHATVVGIAYGTRHIIDALNASGYEITDLYLTGGHARSPLLVRIYADATGCQVLLPREADGVLLGGAVLAATAAGLHAGVQAAGQAMVHTSDRIVPDPRAKDIHCRGYAAYRRMLEQRAELLRLLRGGGELE